MEDARMKVIEWEYQALKAEQAQRIGFCDNMLFVQLALVGGVASWTLTNMDKRGASAALLVIPWICVALGWTYLVNDHTVSRIGKYVREVLGRRIAVALPSVDIQEGNGNTHTVAEPFGWGPFQRTDKRRRSRKWIQWAIDELTFVAPGLCGSGAAVLLAERSVTAWEVTALVVGAGGLVGLAWAIWGYADFGTS